MPIKQLYEYVNSLQINLQFARIKLIILSKFESLHMITIAC